MIRFILIVTTCILVIPENVMSQSVINMSGGTVITSEYQIEFSIGEFAVSTLEQNDFIITQGVLQPSTTYPFVVTKNKYYEKSGFYLKMFPTVAQERLNISTNYENKSNLEIYSVLGQKILDMEFEPYMDIGFLEPGIYFLTMVDIKDRIICVEKFIKH